MENQTHEERAKVVIEVVAGLVPGTPIEEFTKRFAITSKEWEDKTGDAAMKTYGFAQEYMRTLWNPSRINWVRCDWIYL